jgi:hypothetical protein
MFLLVTTIELTSIERLITGIGNAIAASGDVTKEVLSKSNVHRKGKYFPL